jgi:topoisomerase-4 subunit A
VPITTLIELEPGSQVAHYFAGSAAVTLLLANSGGFGLLALAGDMHGRNKAGRSFLTLDAADTLLPPVPVQPGQTQVACLSADGRLLVFPLDELKLQSNGGKGLTLMDVDAQTPLLSVRTFAQSLKVLGSGRGGKPKEEELKLAALANHAGRRARKGRKVEGLQKVLRLG